MAQNVLNTFQTQYNKTKTLVTEKVAGVNRLYYYNSAYYLQNIIKDAFYAN